MSRIRRSRSLAAVVFASVVCASAVVPPLTTPPPLAAASGELDPEYLGGGGFSAGPASQIGLVAQDVAWDSSRAQLLVAECELAWPDRRVAVTVGLPSPEWAESNWSAFSHDERDLSATLASLLQP